MRPVAFTPFRFIQIPWSIDQFTNFDQLTPNLLVKKFRDPPQFSQILNPERNQTSNFPKFLRLLIISIR